MYDMYYPKVNVISHILHVYLPDKVEEEMNLLYCRNEYNLHNIAWYNGITLDVISLRQNVELVILKIILVPVNILISTIQ